jgi:4-amino-4-deoxy-L-arabinose transferase-like glycosyltransferase
MFAQTPRTALPLRQPRPGLQPLRHLFTAGFLLLLTIFYMKGLGTVPFHPDESTQLFMSSDVEALLHDPSSLAWQPEKESDLKQHYHELDAPLTRTLIGAFRLAAGLPPLPADWNWSATWLENQASGAIPGQVLLLLGRAAVAWLFPFSLVLCFLIAARLKGYLAGLAMALLFAGNALIMIHTRRAMAESALVFGVCLSIWGLVESEKSPWLAALGIALAFNAKQSAVALVPVGLLAAAWVPAAGSDRLRKIIIRVSIFIIIFLAVTFTLNPMLWNKPLLAAQAALKARQEFVAGQIVTLQRLAPGQVLSSPVDRLAAMLLHLYIMPPAVEDAGNYIQDLEPGRSAYLADPGHSLLRGLGWGGLVLGLSLTGFVIAVLQIRRSSGQLRRNLVLLTAATLIQSITLLATVPIPWQRYWMPLVPFTCLWTVYGSSLLVELGRAALRRAEPVSG